MDKLKIMIIIIILFQTLMFVTMSADSGDGIDDRKLCYSYPSDVELGLYASMFYYVDSDENCSDWYDENSTFTVIGD